MCANPERRIKLAFTLIELLVVVAIIALLISILLPSLNRARDQARQLVCLTQLRSQGEAASFYSEDNAGYLPRGIQDWTEEYHIFATAVLKYLGFQGDLELGVTADTSKLWSYDGPPARTLNKILRRVPQFQCPDFPNEVKPDGNHHTESPLDYVASAFAIPFPPSGVAMGGGDLEWEQEGGYQYEDPPRQVYIMTSKLEQMTLPANPAGIIYVTESHTSLTWKDDGPRYHHVFLASQLPFAAMPRIANDQRHPGGINALFFDGHAQTMDLHQMDVAYPNTLDKRLKYFTLMYEGWQP